jgi:long-chain acyl-CoA synthetase
MFAKARKTRRVGFDFRAQDGLVGFYAALPPVEALAMKDRLQQLAAVPAPRPARPAGDNDHNGDAGDGRCHDERMADALIASVLGAQPEDPTRPVTPQIQLQVLVPLATLLGLREDTAELVGYGDIPASMAREMAGDAAWQRWVHDDVTGHLLDQGKHTYPPTPSSAATSPGGTGTAGSPAAPTPPPAATKTTPNRSIIAAHKTAPPQTPRRATSTNIPAVPPPPTTSPACADACTGPKRSATTKPGKTPTAPCTGPPPSAAPTPPHPTTTDPTATATTTRAERICRWWIHPARVQDGGMTLSIASLLAESARRFPAKTAVICDSQRVTYAELWDQARRYAAVLQDRGIGPGDRVAMLMPNLPCFPMTYYGVLALGAVVVPIHSLLKAEEIAFVLTDAEISLLVCAAPLLGEGVPGAKLAGVPLLAVLESDDPGIERIEVLAQGFEPVRSYVAREAADDAVLLYTSGTTGKPKGAVLSHLNMVMNAQLSSAQILELVGDDVILAVLPLFHSFGQTCVMNASFFRGTTMVMMPRFDGVRALELMLEHGVTVFEGVPTMYISLLEAARKDPRRPRLRNAISGGASLPITVIEAFHEVFDVDIYEGYGLSETAPVATFNQPVYGRKAGTVGCAIWGVEVEIARPEIEEAIELLPVGELGEVVIRGHNVMTRYHNRPEATAAAIVDGWFRSGDLGTLDADGFVTIVDRKKDMVLRGGFNVYPREVEEALLRHPAIAQVAVIAVPDERYGEEVCAVVILAPDLDPSAELEAQIIAWSRERLAAYKYPRLVRFVDALPLGPSGKVLKRELAAQFGANQRER